MDQVNMRTMYLGGKLEAALTFWNPPAPENWLWRSATINRVAGRVHWKVPDDVRKLVADAGAERDLAKVPRSTSNTSRRWSMRPTTSC